MRFTETTLKGAYIIDLEPRPDSRGFFSRVFCQREFEAHGLKPVIAQAMERGGRLAAKAQVTDSLLDRCRPIAGTPDDCIRAIEEYRDAGCTHVMLELWGADRHDQIRLFGQKVLPHFRG